MKYLTLFLIVALALASMQLAAASPIFGENGCVPMPCAFPSFCSSWTMGTYQLADGTICPGCPICTSFNNNPGNLGLLGKK